MDVQRIETIAIEIATLRYTETSFSMINAKRLDHESIVALAELIVVENNTPSFFNWEKFELGSFSNLEINLSDLKESRIRNSIFGLIC